MTYPITALDRTRVAAHGSICLRTVDQYFHAGRPMRATTRARVEQALRECGFAHLIITPTSPAAGPPVAAHANP